MFALKLLVVGILWAGMLTPAHGAQLTVAAASSVQEPVVELARQFEARTGHRVRPVFGASGKFFAQITQGAPYDVLFSADADYPSRLHARGLGEAPRRYALGHLVLWAPFDSPFVVEGGLDVLRDRRIRRVAVANPTVAPHGRAAIAAMRAAGVHGAVSGKLVRGENVAQAVQFVESGGADLALIPLSLALSPKLQGRGKYWRVPAGLHEPLVSEALVLTGAKDRALARRFLDHCTGKSAQAVWRRFGLVAER